jgi:hypothetical protein
MWGKWAFRGAALLAVGAVILHQADYVLGGAGNGPLAGHDHGYLPLVMALATVLLLIACAGFAGTLWRAAQGRVDQSAPPRFLALWPGAAIALLAVFSLQESIESWAAPGHPAGIAHVAEHVGWMGVLLAIALGGVIAAMLRGAHSATRLVAKRRAERRRPRPAVRLRPSLPAPFLTRLDVLAVHSAGRAPPAVCS